MKNEALQIFIWLLGLLALSGNFTVIVWRSKLKLSDSGRVNSLLLKNLAVADFLMGVYLLIIALKDVQWRGQYFKHDEQWRASRTCEIVGILSLISSEVSVLTLAVITTDRFVSIVLSMRVRKLSRRKAYVLIALVWLIPIVMAVTPLLGPDSYFYDQEASSGFYGHSAVCLPLQLSQQRFAGWQYSAGIFLALNLAAFLFIMVAYLAIFCKARSTSLAVRSSTHMGHESALARRLTFIILTDFCCWMPVILIGILSLLGKFHDPDQQAYAWITVFVLPVNSSINPILYTFSTRDWRSRSVMRNTSIHSLSPRPRDRLNRNMRIRSFSNKGFDHSNENVIEMKTLTTLRADDREVLENAHATISTTADAPKLRLKFLEVANVFSGETSSAIGFVIASGDSLDAESRFLVKCFSNNKEEEWKKEKDMMALLSKDGGHPNVMKACCNAAAITIQMGSNDVQQSSLKGISMFLCYEFVSSVTLESFLDDSKEKLILATLLAVATDIIDAIGHLEKCGISHNNIAPQNILVAQCLKIPPIRAVLGGFGSASILERSVGSESRSNADLNQYGKLLEIMLQECDESCEKDKVLRIIQICRKPNMTAIKIRDFLDEAWDSTEA